MHRGVTAPKARFISSLTSCSLLIVPGFEFFHTTQDPVPVSLPFADLIVPFQFFGSCLGFFRRKRHAISRSTAHE
jgi:hypothetical protein